MLKSKELRLVLIEWVDSTYTPAWTLIEDLAHKAGHHMSVGWLLHDGKKAKTIAPHLGPNQANGTMTIPTCSITRIRDLPEPT